MTIQIIEQVKVKNSSGELVTVNVVKGAITVKGSGGSSVEEFDTVSKADYKEFAEVYFR